MAAASAPAWSLEKVLHKVTRVTLQKSLVSYTQERASLLCLGVGKGIPLVEKFTYKRGQQICRMKCYEIVVYELE